MARLIVILNIFFLSILLILLVNSAKIEKDDKMHGTSMAVACRKLTPVKSDYVAQGTTFNIGDLPVYETKDKSPKSVIIVGYDIFGMYPTTQQVVDKLAEAGFRVVLPDFFRGKPYDMAKFPPKDFAEIINWANENGSWNKTTKNDVIRVMNYYKEKDKINSFAVLGFCWGGRMVMDALIDIPDIKAGVSVHPAFWKTEDAQLIKKPTFVMPTKDEDDMIPFWEILKKNLGTQNCGHHRFADMQHGFCSARGDMKNDLNRQRVDEALAMMEAFYTKHMK